MQQVKTLVLPLAMSMIFATVCEAEPVHLETAAAHIIVVRPIDTWAGNRTTGEYTLNGLKAKKVAFFYYDAAGNKVLGSGGLFSKPPQTPVVVGVQQGLEQRGYTNNGPSGMAFIVEKAVDVPVAKMADFAKVQNDLYQEYVIGQGDPSTLSDRIMAKKFVNVGLALAVLNVGIERFGAVNGSQYVFSSGIADDIAALSLHERLALTAVPAAVFDYTPYASVQVRKITFGSDRVGQIVIAYKGEHTSAAEDEALAAAIVTASGADTTTEAVVAAREADYQNRVRIWASCQAKEACAKN